MPVESELERGARMKSVGVLSPSYTLLYRYMHFLENQVRYVACVQVRVGGGAAGTCRPVCFDEPSCGRDRVGARPTDALPRRAVAVRPPPQVTVFWSPPASCMIILHTMKAGVDFALSSH